MTDNESRWAERVAAWRASGATAPVFCKDKDFTASGLRYWASKLGNVRLARVVRAAPAPHETESPILLEVGAVRLGIRRGFDPATLRAILEVLGGAS